ncbi:hypothetical protein [Haloterrigena alkaliphila]|uniref:Uncharacterized protein n=1 Tax=Haloterrigena alkaliphila TaxID=2816475 RepID=A0A8A2VG79_9EURY|nr:hypothetical protein [Haloterrigena alkaliphila]QSX00327.1 hypothetical protein J0X25_05005 [Haloterrigena alkaliphila]
MIDRSSLATATLVVVLVASLPAGVAVTAAAQEVTGTETGNVTENVTGTATENVTGTVTGNLTGSETDSNETPQLEDASLLDSLGCLPAPSLRDISMNAYQQESTNLETQSSTVTSREHRRTEVEATFRIESGYIAADTLCIDGAAEESGGVRLRMNGVEFEETTLLGPRTDVAFAQGEADTLTVVLPPEEVLTLLAQVPDSIDMIDTIRDAFGIEDEGETEAERNESDDNTTDIVDDPLENTTDAVNDTIDNTTDVVEGTLGNSTDAVDDTVDNTTDVVDDTVDNTTDAVDDTTDAVDDTIDNTTDTVDETTDAVDNTTDTVDDTADNTTDVVDDTVDNTTDAVEETVDNTTDAVEDTLDTTTDLLRIG